MCPRTTRGSSDLTTVDRIRNAAIARFAKDGFGAGLRAIAADAKVTAGLITHHFGSKEGLRHACDSEVLRLAGQAKTESTIMGGPVDVLTQMAQVEDYVPASAYALRSLMEGGPLATALLDSFIAETVDYMSKGVAAGALNASFDEEARSRYLMYSGFGAIILFARYEASDPTDIEVVTREFMQRYSPVAAELYSQPLLANPEAVSAYIKAVQKGERQEQKPQ